MSNSLAIAAATATLRSLLSQNGLNVTVKPPDIAGSDTGDHINLFLYQMSIDAAWRNQDLPKQVKAGESAHPPLALCLYYLVTAFAQNNDELKAHKMLGNAMSALHDHPLLDADEIKNATQADLSDSDLQEQIERVRITPQPLSLEDGSKLWTAFQTHYRLSAAYQVSVILIESKRRTRALLPVLVRGKDDSGVRSFVGRSPTLDEIRVPLSGAFKILGSPTIEEMRLTKALPSAQLGDEIALIGQNFTGDTVRVVLKHQGTGESFEPDIVKISDQIIIVKLLPRGDANDPETATAKRPAGFYQAKIVIVSQRADEPDRPSNSCAFTLAPTIKLSPLQAASGNIQLTVTCTPMIRPDQRVALLFRDSEIVAPNVAEATDTLVFTLPKVPAGQPGEYVVRLRVDGIDSLPVDRAATTPKFADSQILKVV